MTVSEALRIVKTAASLPELIRELTADGASSGLILWAYRAYMDIGARENAVPLTGTFELTPFCNLDCRMCYVRMDGERPGGKRPLTGDEWIGIIDQAIDAGMMYATLTGGECLTCPDFDRLYLHLQSRGVQITVLTNGVLLTEERIRFFRENVPLGLQITLYGADDDTYEKVTGHRRFACVTENIRRARDAGLRVTLSLTPNPYMTEEETERLIRFASELLPVFRINSTLNTPRPETGRAETFCDLSPEFYARMYLFERELRGEPLPELCGIPLPPTETDGDGEAAPRGLRCAGGRSSFAVGWDGIMSPCADLREISGDLLREDFAAVWNRNNEAVKNYRLPVECETCAYRNAAKSCVLAHKNAVPGHCDPKECRWCRTMVRTGIAGLAD